MIRMVQARPEDAQAIVALAGQSDGGAGDGPALVAGDLVPDDLTEETARLERQAASGGYSLVAWDGLESDSPRPLGFVSVDCGEGPQGRNRASVSLLVPSGRQDVVIGDGLMRVVISRLSADLGVDFVTLEVRCDDERAVRLFERLRFEVVGTKRGAIEFDGELVDAYGMRLDLNALRPSI